jgi:hypothetical protein
VVISHVPSAGQGVLGDAQAHVVPSSPHIHIPTNKANM